MKFTAPIVGMAFRPPAQFVLQELPFGTELELKRQPDNPHDSNAIQVFLHGFTEEKFKSYFDEALPDDLPAGRNLWNKAALTDPLFLGYVAAKTGEAAELATILDMAGEVTAKGILGATLEGKPAVLVELTVPEEKLEARPEPKPPLDDEIPF